MFHFTKAAPAVTPCKRSVEDRRAARQERAARERRIVGFLNAGVSIAEIAAREDVTEKRMRALISEILGRRMPEPPAQFLAMQVSRLNEALLVAYGAMAGGNLRAVDRVIKIVRELDRYHGFGAERRSAPGASPLGDAEQSRVALDPPSSVGPEIRKWRRKGLKTLNPRLEMAWPPKSWTRNNGAMC